MNKTRSDMTLIFSYYSRSAKGNFSSIKKKRRKYDGVEFTTPYLGSYNLNQNDGR